MVTVIIFVTLSPLVVTVIIFVILLLCYHLCHPVTTSGDCYDLCDSVTNSSDCYDSITTSGDSYNLSIIILLTQLPLQS